jgi:hypothetical protein
MREYDYTVQFVGNYYEISTKVTLELDEYTGNCDVRERAVEEADRALCEELGISPLNFAHSTLVTLNLDMEDIAL